MAAIYIIFFTLGNSKWTGVRLRDVLKGVGATKLQGVKHVHFEGCIFAFLFFSSIKFQTLMCPRVDF